MKNVSCSATMRLPSSPHVVAVPWDGIGRPELAVRRLEVTHGGIPASCVLLGRPPETLRFRRCVEREHWNGQGYKDVEWFEETAEVLRLELRDGVVAVVGPTEAVRRLFRRPDLQDGYPSEVAIPNEFVLEEKYRGLAGSKRREAEEQRRVISDCC